MQDVNIHTTKGMDTVKLSDYPVALTSTVFQCRQQCSISNCITTRCLFIFPSCTHGTSRQQHEFALSPIYMHVYVSATDTRETVSKDNWKGTHSIRNEN